jgi:membrane protease YdiL (CAAX protease family)
MDIILAYVGIMGVGIIAALLPVKMYVNDIGYFLYGFIIQFLATVGFVYLFAVLLPRGKWRDLGVCKARPHTYFRYGIIGGILLIIMVLAMGYVLKYVQPDLQPQYYEEMLRSAIKLPEFILVFIMGAVLAPISEELFYRGMIYTLLRKHLGPVWGAILAGLIFGLAHWDLWRTLPLAIGGAALCYIYEKSGSILVSAVAHGVWNGVVAVIVYLSLVAGI